MENKLPLIGITGYAKSGKDTLFSVLDANLGVKLSRYAFADALKQDLQQFVNQYYGFDIFSLTEKQKNIVRPLMVAYGCGRREIDPLVWVKNVDTQIRKHQLDERFIPVITDIRFENEALFLRENYDLVLIKVSRNVDGKPLPPPNEEEKVNQPKVDKLADHFINWPTVVEDNGAGADWSVLFSKHVSPQLKQKIATMWENYKK